MRGTPSTHDRSIGDVEAFDYRSTHTLHRDESRFARPNEIGDPIARIRTCGSRVPAQSERVRYPIDDKNNTCRCLLMARLEHDNVVWHSGHRSADGPHPNGAMSDSMADGLSPGKRRAALSRRLSRTCRTEYMPTATTSGTESTRPWLLPGGSRGERQRTAGPRDRRRGVVAIAALFLQTVKHEIGSVPPTSGGCGSSDFIDTPIEVVKPAIPRQYPRQVAAALTLHRHRAPYERPRNPSCAGLLTW